MVKNTLIYVVVILLVGISGWFFMSKMNDASTKSDLSSIVSPTATPTASSSPEASAEPNKSVKLENGLEIQDIVIGTGDEAQPGDMVAAHYSGTLANGTKFDNSYDRGQPFVFVLGGGMVIQGWDLGLVGMKVGGKRKLIIPPQLGYGDRGAGGGAIPPNSTLYFDIELMGVQKAK